jgi:hypothetical protein
MKRLVLAIAIALITASCNAGRQEPEQSPANTATNADTDTSESPGATAESPEGLRTAAAQLRSDQIRTRHLVNNAVTAGKVALTAVTVNVAGAATTGSSAAAPTLVGGILISCDPSGNQDQHMDNAVLNGDGSITVTLAVAATAQNNFRCIVFRANSFGVT